MRTLSSAGAINAEVPVNWQTPANLGLVGWWVGLPFANRGKQLVDIVGGNHGALTSFATGYGWQDPTRVGGFGELNYDATGYIDCGTKVPDLIANWSVSGWFRRTGNGGRTANALWSRWTTNSAQRQLYVYVLASSNQIVVDVPFKANVINSPTVIANNVWYHWAVTRLGSAWVLYLNGLKDSTGSSAVAQETGATLNLGGCPLNVGYWLGQQDDVRAYSRARSADEILWEYNQGRAGYPALLNRSRGSFVPQGATSTTVVVIPASIATSESFGVATLASSAGLNPSSIATGESVATATSSATATLAPSTIATSASTGLPTSGVSATVVASPIATGESWASPSVSSTADLSPASIASSEALYNPLVAAAVTPTASFVGTDTATQGTWKGVYGTLGYRLAADGSSNNPNLPATEVLTLAGQTDFTFADPSVRAQALVKAAVGATERIEAVWYGLPESIDLASSSTGTRRVSLYCCDFNSGGRTTRLDVADADTGTILDSRSISGFSGGIWITWDIRGHCRITATNTAGVNAVVSGVFFDTASTAIFLAGIDSSASVASPSLSASATSSPGSIASGEAAGSPSLGATATFALAAIGSGASVANVVVSTSGAPAPDPGTYPDWTRTVVVSAETSYPDWTKTRIISS